ncbi:MAG: hypothetical protein ACOYEV_12870 [Candidatus Nanopelagicales bacterium]
MISPSRYALAAAGLVLVAGGPAATPASASAISARPATLNSQVVAKSTAKAVAACTRAGKVWLAVLTPEGRALANKCVGNPTTGLAALRAAKLTLTTSPGGYVCTIGHYPDRCPTRFTGTYWQYYHAQPGGPWIYSSRGASNYKPIPGSLEGWCYSKARCSPPAELPKQAKAPK